MNHKKELLRSLWVNIMKQPEVRLPELFRV